MHLLATRSALVLSCALGGCHWGLLGLIAGGGTAQGSYQPGTIAAELGSSSVRTLGCLDLGLMVSDRDDGPLLDMYVGNHCVRSAALTLDRLYIVGRDASGAARSVGMDDPRSEIVSVHVGGVERGHERIRLRTTYDIDRVCFHLEDVAPDAPEARPEPLCFHRSRGRWEPTA
jgi:hypothetical protein